MYKRLLVCLPLKACFIIIVHVWDEVVWFILYVETIYTYVIVLDNENIVIDFPFSRILTVPQK